MPNTHVLFRSAAREKILRGATTLTDAVRVTLGPKAKNVLVDGVRVATGNTGFDAPRGVYCDLVGAGIIDPTKVVRVALENAVSVAGTLLLTEASLTEIPEPPSEHRAPAEL